MSASQRWLMHDFAVDRVSFLPLSIRTSMPPGLARAFLSAWESRLLRTSWSGQKKNRMPHGKETSETLCIWLYAAVFKGVLIWLWSLLCRPAWRSGLFFGLSLLLASGVAVFLTEERVCWSSRALAASGKHIRAVFWWTESRTCYNFC